MQDMGLLTSIENTFPRMVNLSMPILKVSTLLRVLMASRVIVDGVTDAVTRLRRLVRLTNGCIRLVTILFSIPIVLGISLLVNVRWIDPVMVTLVPLRVLLADVFRRGAVIMPLSANSGELAYGLSVHILSVVLVIWFLISVLHSVRLLMTLLCVVPMTRIAGPISPKVVLLTSFMALPAPGRRMATKLDLLSIRLKDSSAMLSRVVCMGRMNGLQVIKCMLNVSSCRVMSSLTWFRLIMLMAPLASLMLAHPDCPYRFRCRVLRVGETRWVSVSSSVIVSLVVSMTPEAGVPIITMLVRAVVLILMPLSLILV